MNLLLEKTDQVPFFTNMCLVFHAMGISARDFDWYVSDIEVNSGFDNRDRWVTGEELHETLRQRDIQFIWAVFSAVPKGFRCSVPCRPCADGNPSFWEGDLVKPQLPEALFEIVCWDGSATILVGVSTSVGASFVKSYPDAKPL